MKLNVGCGRAYMPGYVNIDISKEVKADRYLDIRKDALPFPDKSVVDIVCSGVLEQIGSNDEFLFAWNEMHRVLKQNGILTVVVPNARYAIAHRDPMDVRKFTRETFDYFLRDCPEHKEYGSVYGFGGYKEMKMLESKRHIFTIMLKK